MVFESIQYKNNLQIMEILQQDQTALKGVIHRWQDWLLLKLCCLCSTKEMCYMTRETEKKGYDALFYQKGLGKLQCP